MFLINIMIEKLMLSTMNHKSKQIILKKKKLGIGHCCLVAT